LSVLLAAALTIVLAELLLRLLQPTATNYMALVPGTRATFHSKYFSGVAGPALYQVNAAGARGHDWSPDRGSELRVLAIGGSTTECLYNDQSRVWTTLLEEQLGNHLDGRTAWVGNIGRSGLNSRHHVLQTQHLDAYDPDVVVMLVGVNDFCQRLLLDVNYDPHYLDRAEHRQKLLEQAFEVRPHQPKTFGYENDPWFKQTRLWRLLRTIKHHHRGTALVQDPNGESIRLWRDLRAAGNRRDQLPDLTSALEEYSRNLYTIIDNVRDYGAQLVLITQPTLWRDSLTPEEESTLWLGGIGDFQSNPGCTYYTAAALAKGMAEYNATLRAVCQARGVPCVDLALLIDKSTDNFYDDCHFTDRANRLIADALADALQDFSAGDGASPQEGPQR